VRVLFKRNVSITACFDFQSNGAARQREPFIFDPRALCSPRQVCVRPRPTVNVASCDGLYGAGVRRRS
jgi:hypothetical protein